VLKRILKIGALTFIAAPILLVVLTHIALRSERLVLGYLLPFISKQSGQKITAQSADLRLLSGIKLSGLRYNCASDQGSCAAEGSLGI
jgi:hypothetical protein